MLLTEDEAKKRWCPHARVPCYEVHPTEDEGPASANRAPIVLGGENKFQQLRMAEATRCIGSACLAWRFVQMEIPRFVVREVPPAELAAWQRERPSGYLEVQLGEEPPIPVQATGYCGLAGKP